MLKAPTTEKRGILMKEKKTLEQRLADANTLLAELRESGMFAKPVLTDAVLTLLRQKEAITAQDIRAQLETWADDPNFEVSITGTAYSGERAQGFASDAIAHLTKSLLK